MAKQSVLKRERKRTSLRIKYCAYRNLLRGLLRQSKSPDETQNLNWKLYNLPRDSSLVRKRNRCLLTGRSRGFYRLFGLSRMPIRNLISKGELPGITKSSW
ncbi:putative 30S ribosomal subunit protein S14 [Candidatus Tremblaya phenacola PAVE]|nr:putative 30S ribosomal subunit protein S14 [Candidatus Tremblaya phenacola PAVE]